MDGDFDYDSFDDELIDYDSPATCRPITEAELESACSDSVLRPSTPIKLFAHIDEDRRGDARTIPTITGNGPLILSSRVFSMHRVLWADGVMQGNKMDKTDDAKSTPATTKATLAAFKVYLDSQTKSSGSGKDAPIRRARIRVEFHSTGPDAGTVEAQRPVVVGWAPFAATEKSNATTAEHTKERSIRASFQGGASTAKGTVEATASNTRVWTADYFALNRSRPVTVAGKTGTSYNGVEWSLAQNRLAADGVPPEVLLYLLVTRQDDTEYAVKVTAHVDTARLFGHKQHECVLRVKPKAPSSTGPAVCYLEGEKMWQMLDASHFEALLSPAMDASLKLPWDVDGATTEISRAAGAKDSGADKKAGAKDGKDPEKETTQDDEDDENDEDSEDNEGDKGDNNDNIGDSDQDENDNAPDVGPTATVAVRVAMAKKRNPNPSSDGGGDAAALLGDPPAVLKALSCEPCAEGCGKCSKNEDLITQVAVLESRMEVMEYQLARQALLIRSLMKHRGQ
ncbi:hypothetical protein SCUCBS95973_002371 [Sporothrix curviconia]|uniref:Uncharacterized protein n=1 Tax=Sporothrix curviconia TaxID=1260050 RepID=A0ABP0B6H2_9PEZI